MQEPTSPPHFAKLRATAPARPGRRGWQGDQAGSCSNGSTIFRVLNSLVRDLCSFIFYSESLLHNLDVCVCVRVACLHVRFPKMRRLSWTFSSHVAFLLVVLGALWSRPGRCQRVKDTQFAFINPSGPDLSTEKNYTIGEAERLQWNATYTNITLCLVQDTAANTCEAIARKSPDDE